MNKNSPESFGSLTSQFVEDNRVRSIFSTLRKYLWVWVLPMILFGGLATAYALIGSKQYQASQKLYIRDEMIGKEYQPGRFESFDVMKTAQETIQEVARSPHVLRRTFQQVEGKTDPDWPDDSMIETVQGAVVVSAPNGAELGKTEVVMLTIKAESQEKARELISVLCDETERELRMIRRNRAKSMETELQCSVENAFKNYEESARKLTKLESEVGADLTDLRTLNDPTVGEGSLRLSLSRIRSELRSVESLQDLVDKQGQYLEAAARDPKRLVSIPNELLAMQPTLRQLKEGLTQAQLGKSLLAGKYSASHPKVRNAENRINDINNKIYQELQIAIQGNNSQNEINTSKTKRLKNQKDDIVSRLNRLSELRVPYSKSLQEVDERENVLRSAESKLTEAQSILAAAENVNMITRIDEPQVSSRPLGPSRKLVAGSGTIVGLLFGLGLVMFLSSPTPIPLSSALAHQNPATPTRNTGHQPHPVETTPQNSPNPSSPLPKNDSQPTPEELQGMVDQSAFAVTVEPMNLQVTRTDTGQ